MALPLQGEVDEWWIDLLLGDYFGVDCVDDEVCHMGGTFLDGNEWAEDLPSADPNFGPSRVWPFPRVGLRTTRACCPIGWLRQDLARVHFRINQRGRQRRGTRWRKADRLGTRWYAAETGASVTLGDEVALRDGDVAVEGDAALFKR